MDVPIWKAWVARKNQNFDRSSFLQVESSSYWVSSRSHSHVRTQVTAVTHCDSFKLPLSAAPSLETLGVYIFCERFPVLINDAMPVRCFRDWHTTLTSVLNSLAEALKLYLSYRV